MNGVKLDSSNRIKDGNERLAVGEEEIRRIWKDYFKDRYLIAGCMWVN